MPKSFLVLLGAAFLFAVLAQKPPLQKNTGNIQSEDEIQIAILQGEVDGYPIFVSINSSLKKYAHKSDLPWFVSASTKFQEPAEKGLPKNEEFPGLNESEDLVEARIGKVCRYAYLGHVTHKGEREILFYVDSREAAEDALKKLKGEQRTLKFDYGVTRDDSWKSVAHYLNEKL